MAITPAPNVTRVHGICSDSPDRQLRVVMELCAHGTLRAYVQKLAPRMVR
jgi:hypothetical protein